MNEKHVSDEQLVDLLYGEDDTDTQIVKEHLQSCDFCRERYRALSEILDQIASLPIPELSAGEKVHVFQTAWQSSSSTHQVRWVDFIRPYFRHALSFSAGLACGLILLAVVVSHTEAEVKESAPPVQIVQAENPVPPMLQGTPVAKIYARLENPVIVVQEQEKQAKQRVMEGTMANGSVQVVWNF